MFSTKEYLKRKTGEDGIGRFSYLTMLCNEFKETKSDDAKQQILANLANFAYDPINYEYFRRLQVIDLFLEQLSADDEIFVHFAIAGICNLCLDPINKAYIIRRGGIRVIKTLLSSTNEQILLDSITSLMFMMTPDILQECTSANVIDRIQALQKSDNVRLKNICTLYLENCP